MTVNLTIIGLGQIGTSVGLALADQSEVVFRLGHDREISKARKAEKMGALDKVSINLPSAVREADLVLLALPVDQIRDRLAENGIAEALTKKGTSNIYSTISRFKKGGFIMNTEHGTYRKKRALIKRDGTIVEPGNIFGAKQEGDNE